MRTATAHATATATPDRSGDSRMHLQIGKEEALLNLDLSDLVLPKVNNLQVDGLQGSWLSRLFGKK